MHYKSDKKLTLQGLALGYQGSVPDVHRWTLAACQFHRNKPHFTPPDILSLPYFHLVLPAFH